MPISLDQVDAFASGPFSGNPAAVCLLPEPADAAWMAAVAEENRLSETAFVLAHDDGTFGLRWFGLTREVQLCGHATLASAHVLWERGHVRPDQTIRFQTRFSGELTCRREGRVILMDFPALPVAPCDEPDGLLAALGVKSATAIAQGSWDYLVELENADAVKAVAPNFNALAPLMERGAIVTAPGDGTPYDFVSRFFAPAVQVNEDPVTGSAHCLLAPYWQPRIGDRAMRAFQASARGGEVHVRAQGDRVELGGEALTVTHGHLTERASERFRG